MNLLFSALVLLSLTYVASSLKCYQGTGSVSTTTDCTAGLDKCVKITSSGVVVRSCNNAAAMKLLGITGDSCKTTKVGVLSSETCSCSTDGCNGDGASSGSNAGTTALKCHTKKLADAEATLVTCKTGSSWCWKIEAPNGIAKGCEKQGEFGKLIHTIYGNIVDSCKVIKKAGKESTGCTCSKDSCNTGSFIKASRIIQSLTFIFTMIIVSPLITLLFV